MKKQDYNIEVKNKIKSSNTLNIMLNQIEQHFYFENNFKLPMHKYNVGDDVYLPKGTLLHGTYKNIEGLKKIVETGLIAGIFNNDKLSKYPFSVSVWNLQQDYYLKDYINFYSGATVKFDNMGRDNFIQKIDIIPYDKMNNFIDVFNSKDAVRWFAEQTKEARFMPNLVNDNVQIGIIFNGQTDETKKLLSYDILDCNKINDLDVKELVSELYYDNFIKDRKNKDAFFTDRESAIVFGLPSCFIEGILVGRKYEKDKKILNEIKNLLPNCYICNLDGKVIVS